MLKLNWLVGYIGWLRTDAFEVWCWRRLLRVPWTARRSVLGVHWKDWCWSWSSQYFGHLMWRTDSLEKTLMLGKIEGRRRRGRQRMRWLDGIMTQWTWVGWTLGVGDGQGGVVCCGLWGHKESDTTEWLNWTERPRGVGWERRGRL